MTEPEDFSIGAVSRLTGISPHTLRVWERRYDIEPSRRSQGGRRLYSSDDVERLTMLKALVDRGDRIGKIAGESVGALRQRMAAFEDHTAARTQLATGTRNVAIFGENLAEALRESPLPGSRIVLAESDIDRFRADLGGAAADTLILEMACLKPDSVDNILALMQQARTELVLVVYGFGRTSDVERLIHRGIKVLRAPAERHAMASMLGLRSDIPPASSLASSQQEKSAEASMQAPPRILSAGTLQRLARVSTTVDCECPHHLVDLVRNLSAFELYSRQCQNRNADDAALHAYLHVTTARARALMEEALVRTAEAEGIEI